MNHGARIQTIATGNILGIAETNTSYIEMRITHYQMQQDACNDHGDCVCWSDLE